MNYSGIIYEDKNHGDGLRCTLLVQGSNKNPENIAEQYRNPKDGVLFTEGTKEDIINYISSNDNIQGLSIAGGDPFCDENVNTIYEFISIFKVIFKDTKDIWIYTEYDWQNFIFWKNIKESGLLLGDIYITILKTIKLVDVVHCRYIFSKDNYTTIKIKEALNNNNLQHV